MGFYFKEHSLFKEHHFQKINEICNFFSDEIYTQY